MQIKPSYTQDGIVYFTPPHNISSSESTHLDFAPSHHFPTQGMDMLYLAENKHFWHIARREFIFQSLSSTLDSLYPNDNGKHVKILDVGAGTGSVTRHFLSQGFHNIALGEIHPQGLEYAKTYGINNLYCMDLLDAPFKDEFDCIFAFDVLEHIDDDKNALLNMKSMLKDNEKSLLALSVPAHQWLWNAHDCLVHHKRRYNKIQLTNLVRECGLSIESAQYFFIALTPLLLARAVLNPASKVSKLDTQELRDVPPPKILNSALLGICRLENKLIPYLPNCFGGSLLVIARNK